MFDIGILPLCPPPFAQANHNYVFFADVKPSAHILSLPKTNSFSIQIKQSQSLVESHASAVTLLKSAE